MAQVTSGLRSVLSSPGVYSAFQTLVGATRLRKAICAEYIRANAGDILVDVGCGPAEILDHLDPSIRYHGFDLSQAYIDTAREQYGDRGQFHCADITQIADDAIPPCQVALALGLLHHLDDDGARGLIAHLYKRLAPGGRLITLDGGYWPSQSRAARWLISKDRGQNVRPGEAYRDLAAASFDRVELIRRDDLLNIPYSHAILVCTK
ncbi:class I SAM-dependent methyltransferase [Luteimonas aquatica]|uniref:class I SAM-dependent methyltransferase n=1 Tax=Luteimonas aquatica TaxID=450364 RepID=UPI001F5A114B|nr:class I SAM-dependent methyltransferase [Luteimonas aquatica]